MSGTISKWLSFALGCLFGWAALGLPERVMPPKVGNPLFLLAIMLALDCLISFRAFPYATINGPEERRIELERRYFRWDRSRWRYAYISISFTVVFSSVQRLGLGDWYLYAMVGVIVGYGLISMIQMFGCRKEASAVFPPNVR